jgi:carnitine-CoA ligase
LHDPTSPIGNGRHSRGDQGDRAPFVDDTVVEYQMSVAAPHGELNLNSRPQVISDVLRARAHALGDKTFLRFLQEGETLTYLEAASKSERIARGLLSFGVGRGDKLGLLLFGSKSYVLAWYATLRGSVVDVPINPDARGEVLDHAITKMDVTALLVDAEGLEALASASPETRAQLALVVIVDSLYDNAVRDELIPVGIGRAVSLNEVELAGEVSGQALPEVDSLALASIRFSSGTTGLPKGVMMHHGHMLTSARKFNELMSFGEVDTMYTCFPFHHVFATITGVLSTMCAGASMIISRKFSASRYWQEIRDNNVTRAHLLDPLVSFLMNQPPSELDRAHKVPLVYTAARHYPEFEERFGVRIIGLYDMSELTVVAHYPEGAERRPGSCGKLSGLFDVAIVDDNRCPLPDGADGEILVRPRYPGIMFMGYYNDSDETVARWQDMWFETGDRGRKEPDGYFYFLGRSGDRIRRRGVNVSAEQVEQAALSHPDVLECAAIAVPSPLGEDDIKLCACLLPGAETTPQEIAELLLDTLPRALTVRYVEIFDELPKTQTEKVKRAALRALGDRGLTPNSWDHETQSFVGDGATQIPQESQA